jgi:hypothetical protein
MRPILHAFLAPALVVVAALQAAAPKPAAAFERVADPSTFETLVVGRELTRTGIRLRVLPGGRILGRGLAWPVTGEWAWQEGFFCRTMDWSGYEIAYNCMTVLANDRSVRFIADRGTGESADFRLR